jgi:hypothetical protein
VGPFNEDSNFVLANINASNQAGVTGIQVLHAPGTHDDGGRANITTFNAGLLQLRLQFFTTVGCAT